MSFNKELYLEELSLALSNVMEDIGISQSMITFRRIACWLQESYNSFQDRRYIFGSQSEGSTTLGLNSDFDQLIYSPNKQSVGLHLSTMRVEDNNDHLVQTPFTLPQCCSLQLVWPKQITDQTYAKLGFILMQLPYSTDFLATQWRMSTNLTERCLMFDLNLVHMKAYAVTKLLRKEYLKRIVGDRLSTFHLKTVLMFTVEQTPPEIWTDKNLVQCIIRCLKTLTRFLKCRNCPHYTTSGVNVFANKIKVHEYQLLLKMLDVFVSTNLYNLFAMKIDDVGQRMSAAFWSENHPTNNYQLPSREENEHSIIKTVLENVMLHSPIRLMKHAILEKYNKCTASMLVDALQADIPRLKLFSCTEENLIKNNAIDMWIQTFRSNIATIQASSCIDQKTPITKEITMLYETSIKSGMLACYLKFSSMLIVTGQNERAVSLLLEIEEQIQPIIEVVPFPGSPEPVCCRTTKSITPSAIKYILKMSLPIVFLHYEVNCIPQFLAYEIYSTYIPTLNNDAAKDYVSTMKNDVTVDALPLLYYLKFVACRLIGKTDLQQAAFDEILKFRIPVHQIGQRKATVGATTMNMIGHCWELNNNFIEAVKDYSSSQEINPHNNAASWHIFSLVGRCLLGEK
ncbi:hypothetical protein DPMN_106400 [Dreissena polymorpha]|uniref:Mab-21-like HhH/H2TH-like domain-containing protein n=1 Tax=Dreissena polymorpha TaxID=45954 RepID=A0A9D4QIT6_DREPO|nr:hypothetical protein DPMN_106400 [Dreissena polymorpha]